MKKTYIITEARQIREYVEKNNRIPLTNVYVDGKILSIYSTSYLMAKLLKNWNTSDIKLSDVIIYNQNTYKDTINEKVRLLDYMGMIDNFIAYCNNHKRVPTWVTTQTSKTRVSYELFVYCLAKIITYYADNKALPNYCIFDKNDLMKNEEDKKEEDNVVIRFSKAEMSKAKKNLRGAVKRGELPSMLTMTDMAGKQQKIDRKHYMGLFEAQNLFIKNNGKLPNYVTLNSTANNPVIMNYQNDKYSCCVFSFQMCTQYLFDWISPSVIRKAFKTNTNGTTPANMIAGAKSLGYKVTQIKRDYETVRKLLNAGIPVIAHIQTGGKTKPTCLGYVYDYGHYIHINKAQNNNFTVCDPTKGIKTCTASQIIKATGGRSIYFYKIEPL